MRLFVTLCTLWLTWLTLAKADDPKVVCYFGSWAVYRPGNGKFQISDIDPTLCTHLIYSFVGIAENGDIRVLDAWNDLSDDGGKAGFQHFNDLRKRSPSTKTLVAIGGWSEGSAKFSSVMANPGLRAKFVQNVVDFTLRYDFNGFDIDWEYPNQRGGSPADVQNYVHLVKELRAAFDKYGLILSAAVGAAESSASLSYDIRQISEYLHFINIMTYDFHGSWDSTVGFNAPLYATARETSASARSLNVEATVRYWLRQGAPANKLVLGLGTYGRSFTLANPAQNVPGSPASGAGRQGPYTRQDGTLGYNEICELQSQGWTTAWDSDQHVPYAYSGNQWVGFDNVRSITEKAEFAKAMGLGGAMIWSIETDDFRGTCGEKYPILKALNRVLRNGVSSSGPIAAAWEPAKTPEKWIPEIAPPANAGTTGTFGGMNAAEESNVICSRSDNQYFRDPQDCAKFWVCQKINSYDYQAIPLFCGQGLYFDSNIKGCNYAHLVSC